MKSGTINKRKLGSQKSNDQAKSVLTKLFYKELVIIRYKDEKPVRALSESEFHTEFQKKKPHDPYW